MSDSILIKNWSELSKVESNLDYHLEITPKNGNGWIIDSESGKYVEYLSTHTFYEGSYECSTRRLKHYGFDVTIDNWDK